MEMKAIAVDFDQTLITGICFDTTNVDDLTPNEEVVEFVKWFLEDKTVSIGIATYNHNRDKVREFCQRTFGQVLPIASGLPTNFSSGKEEHIKQLFPYAQPGEILLIDDNATNIQVALAHGHLTWTIKT